MLQVRVWSAKRYEEWLKFNFADAAVFTREMVCSVVAVAAFDFSKGVSMSSPRFERCEKLSLSILRYLYCQVYVSHVVAIFHHWHKHSNGCTWVIISIKYDCHYKTFRIVYSLTIRATGIGRRLVAGGSCIAYT